MLVRACKDCMHKGICTMETDRKQVEKAVEKIFKTKHINVTVTCEKWYTNRNPRN
jgi:hypothetical protein